MSPTRTSPLEKTCGSTWLISKKPDDAVRKATPQPTRDDSSLTTSRVMETL
jgi:hypothetical protein